VVSFETDALLKVVCKSVFGISTSETILNFLKILPFETEMISSFSANYHSIFPSWYKAQMLVQWLNVKHLILLLQWFSCARNRKSYSFIIRVGLIRWL
jgi:hypothetical protein